ncbi:MAG: hypothetical protein AAGI44_07185 [Pseudomonadota bacterium]
MKSIEEHETVIKPALRKTHRDGIIMGLIFGLVVGGLLGYVYAERTIERHVFINFDGQGLKT